MSLTSYPPRFKTLHLTLRCLLDQSVSPDRVILWVAHEDMDLLPSSVMQLCDHGLEIRPCDDLRSYKKLVPALQAFPDAFVTVADDDVYYPSDWLETLVKGVELSGQVIIGRRAVRLVRQANGAPAPFRDWEFDVTDDRSRMPSSDLLCEGCGGVLYPPGSLHQLATRRDLFQALCPNGDDLWFYWCARMAGSLIKKVGSSFIVVPWPGTQESSLWSANEGGGNDLGVDALVRALGDVDQLSAKSTNH